MGVMGISWAAARGLRVRQDGGNVLWRILCAEVDPMWPHCAMIVDQSGMHRRKQLHDCSDFRVFVTDENSQSKGETFHFNASTRAFAAVILCVGFLWIEEDVSLEIRKFVWYSLNDAKVRGVVSREVVVGLVTQVPNPKSCTRKMLTTNQSNSTCPDPSCGLFERSHVDTCDGCHPLETYRTDISDLTHGLDCALNSSVTPNGVDIDENVQHNLTRQSEFVELSSLVVRQPGDRLKILGEVLGYVERLNIFRNRLVVSASLNITDRSRNARIQKNERWFVFNNAQDIFVPRGDREAALQRISAAPGALCGTLYFTNYHSPCRPCQCLRTATGVKLMCARREFDISVGDATRVPCGFVELMSETRRRLDGGYGVLFMAVASVDSSVVPPSPMPEQSAPVSTLGGPTLPRYCRYAVIRFVCWLLSIVSFNLLTCC